jgi:trans-2,3-dihydro-3-hydroxyanthranilate isomerase
MPGRFYIVDAFADRPFSGNPAVIVPHADGMTDAAMRALAAELRMEVGFVLSPTRPDADVRLRFFTPGAEVDLSGHVTVAAYAALQAAGEVKPGWLPGTVRQESRAGVVPVELGQGSGPSPTVTLQLGRPVFGPALERREIAQCLKVAETSLAPPAPRIVTCGVAFAVVAMGDPSAVYALTPDLPRVAALSRRRGVLGIAVFARPGLHPASALTARFFFPAVGPDEDVVSGAALAGICAYGVRERLLTCVREATFQTDQGHALGRPNRAHVTVRAEAGQVADVRVRGQGVIVASGDLLP